MAGADLGAISAHLGGGGCELGDPIGPALAARVRALPPLLRLEPDRPPRGDLLVREIWGMCREMQGRYDASAARRSPIYLPYTSPTSPYTSPASPLHLPCISPTSPLHLASAVSCRNAAVEDSSTGAACAGRYKGDVGEM